MSVRGGRWQYDTWSVGHVLKNRLAWPRRSGTEPRSLDLSQEVWLRSIMKRGYACHGVGRDRPFAWRARNSRRTRVLSSPSTPM